MSTLKRYVTFLYIFFCTGFTLGTLTLAVAVESLVAYSRRTGWLYHYQNIIVIGIIMIYVIYALLIALWLARSFWKYSRAGKSILLILLTVATALSLWYWLTPKHAKPDENYIESQDGRFVAGPYPDKEKMLYLKNNDYAAIISLLSPYVVPFEPILMDKESKMAKDVGIPVINIPMLPWVSKNTESIKKIKTLAEKHDNNKYYVHCYYGRDRASMFMRIVDQMSPVIQTSDTPAESQKTSTSITPIAFERGTGYLINEQIIFAPTLTEDEMTLYVVNVKNKSFHKAVRSVISMQTDPNSVFPYEKVLQSYGIPFSVFIINDYPYEPYKILNFARSLRKLPGIILVYTFFTSPNPMPASLEGAMYAYLTNLPSLPYSKFKRLKMSNGHAELIAPNVLMGPEPSRNEYSSYLYYWGIRSIAYIGNCSDKHAGAENKNAVDAKLTFTCYAPHDPRLIMDISQNGPWYVYGPQSGQIEDALESHFAKSIPKIN